LALKLKPKTNSYEETISADCFVCVYERLHVIGTDNSHYRYSYLFSSGEGAIPGVTVTVKGTTVGAITDVNGKYSITAPQSATTLVFSYIGMKKQEVVIGGRKVLDVVMESDILGLDEVVVTAVGIQRSAKSVGYSVSTVSADKTQEKAEPDMLKTLQGKVPGVDIRVGQGAPGAASNITIRGSSSFYGSNQPLIVVDGVPYSNDQVETSSETTGQGALIPAA